MKVRHRQLYSNDWGKCVVNNLLHLYNIKETVDLKYDENGCTIKEIISVLKKYFYVINSIYRCT